MIAYKKLKKGENEQTLHAVAALFKEMYHEMESTGLNMSLTKDGEEKWIKAASQMPGKVNHLIIAEEKDEIIGFAHGNIRLAPEFQGGSKTGFISHVFVMKNFRHSGVASAMVDLLMESLLAAGASRFDLDVLVSNKAAVQFWQSKGFSKELYHMGKPVAS